MMAFGIVASPRSVLTPPQALQLANIYLANACNANDPYITLVLCHDTEVSLSQAKRTAKNFDVHTILEGIATAYIELGKLLDSHGYCDEAQANYKKAEKLEGRLQKQQGRLVPYSDPDGPPTKSTSALNTKSITPVPFPSLTPHLMIPQYIFAEDIRPPAIVSRLPEPYERLSHITQLGYCLSLLKASPSPNDILDPAARQWMQTIEKDPHEKERLKMMATDVIRVFKRDEFKCAKAVAEVVWLAPVLEKEDYRYLLKELYSGINQSDLLEYHQLEGLARLIQGADAGHLDADDLVKTLGLLNVRLKGTHHQSIRHMYQLTMAVSHVLDSMADVNVKDLDREKLHEPLSSYFDALKGSSEPYLVYQAAYAYQALQYVPDNETLWQAAMRRTGKVLGGVSGLVSAVKGIDLNEFIKGLENIQQGLAGASEAFKLTKTIGVNSVAENGQGFLECLKKGLSFKRKRAWYPALRMADALLQNGQFSKFKELVCEAPCRRDPAFLWGACQQLEEVAFNPMWDRETRHGAIAFLGAIYRNDMVLDPQASVKQWVVIILMRLALSSEKGVKSAAETLLRDLESNADLQGQSCFQVCREKDISSFPLRIASTVFASPSLLDRAQNKPDVEGHLRQLMKQRLKEEIKSVYIQLQAKAGLQASDGARFKLMDKVKEFLDSDQKVFLLLGDSGVGKSTFNRALECYLWQTYKKGGSIPLHISLPAIDKPDQDMVAKQLRKAGFTEPQIRELKVHRKFILICDGYDESQQTHNLYSSNRLNQPGEWNAQMVISCRSEYLGVDYRDRFQPGNRNRILENLQFQEAVITPFSADQIHEYVDQYVSMHQLLWEAKEYKQALDLIPSLKELVKNPFLMTLSLEVLPRMMDPGQGLSATRITKVALYDQFVEHWLERGKKRLGEKDLNPQARAAFESLSDEGFTKNGIDFLKKLAVAIYKEQDGQPIVEYSRYKDEGSWKEEFFNREDRQLLREACPLTRNGNQHRFIHRSLLEYGLARAIFDPQDRKQRKPPRSALNRQESTSSVLSFEIRGVVQRSVLAIDPEPDVNSPLVWRNFVNEPSLLQFLEERVQQEPAFKKQLLDYIEHSKLDKKWRTAAANAITILVRAGAEFRFADLQGIRIPGADLSGGVFESARLQGADLRKVNLRNAWLRQTDMSEADMTGAQFGELPYLEHNSGVDSCMYSPDGTSFAVGLVNGSIAVYAVSNWEGIWSSSGHSIAVSSVAYSPDGELIVSGSGDSTVRLWDAKTGVCRQVFTDHTLGVLSVAFSPHGDLIASCGSDCTVRLWDFETGGCRHVLIGHTEQVSKVIYSPKGNQVASGSVDHTVRLWDVKTGVCRHVLRGHKESITSVVYSSQGHLIASASREVTPRIWDAETGECRHTLTGHDNGVICIVFSPRGNQVATGSFDRSVRLWDVETGTCYRTLSGHSGRLSCIEYSPQGDQVVSGSHDNTVRLWDVETGYCLHALTGHVKTVRRVLFSPKGDHVASKSEDGIVRLWDVGSRASRSNSNSHSDSVSSVRHSPNGHQVASSSHDGTIRLWDVEMGTCDHILTGHQGWVYSVAYSPHGSQLASGSRDTTVRLWDVESGACRHILTGHSGAVSSIAYSPQGTWLVSASTDKTVKIWDVETGACLGTLIGHSDEVYVVICSPRGNQVASCSTDKTVRLWDMQTGACQHTLAGHTSEVSCIAYSPRGSWIASGSEDSTIRLWKVETGECRSILSGHSGYITSVVFSPQGRQVASASGDGAVRLWDIETGECRHTLGGHLQEVSTVTFSPGGDLVASVCLSGETRLWDVETGDRRGSIKYDAKGLSPCTRMCRQEPNHRMTWVEDSDFSYLATGGQDGSIRVWEVVNEGDLCRVRMRWRTTTGALTVEDACIQDVQGLSQLDKQLLKQRGALGKPDLHSRESSKEAITMAVVSERRSSSSHASFSVRRSERQTEQVKDSQQSRDRRHSF